MIYQNTHLLRKYDISLKKKNDIIAWAQNKDITQPQSNMVSEKNNVVNCYLRPLFNYFL